MQSIKACPVCDGKVLKPFLSCIDHTVSHETFQLVKCMSCSFVITSPRPTDNALGKYYLSDDYISHSAKSASLFDKVYKFSRLFTLRWKMTLVKDNSVSPSQPNRLLDYGCGTGDFLNTAKKNGFSIFGIEPSSLARAHASELTGDTILESIEQTEGYFDTITLWHVLEHIPDLNEKIAALKNRLAINGTMFIAVPNHLSMDAAIYKQNWAAYDVPRHLWHFNRTVMKNLMKKHLLHVEKIIPMKLDAFYVSMLSEKQKNGKNSFLAMLKGFLIGMKSNYGKNDNEYSSLIYVIKHA
jgi:2-polyprenyl-3-methyl-5-hydroxy-6-metoxy-1,4-benzoquinol methylase